MKKNQIHRGEVLQNAVKASGRKISQLTKRAGYSRGSYYNHVQEPELSYEILKAYGDVLGYDFTADMPEMGYFTGMVLEPESSYETVPQLKKELEAYKQKYYDLLEKYLALKEKMG